LYAGAPHCGVTRPRVTAQTNVRQELSGFDSPAGNKSR